MSVRIFEDAEDSRLQASSRSGGVGDEPASERLQNAPAIAVVAVAVVVAAVASAVAQMRVAERRARALRNASTPHLLPPWSPVAAAAAAAAL